MKSDGLRVLMGRRCGLLDSPLAETGLTVDENQVRHVRSTQSLSTILLVWVKLTVVVDNDHRGPRTRIT